MILPEYLSARRDHVIRQDLKVPQKKKKKKKKKKKDHKVDNFWVVVLGCNAKNCYF